MIRRGQTNKLTITHWEQAPRTPAGKAAVCRSRGGVRSLNPARVENLNSGETVSVLVADDTEMGTQLLADSLRRNHHFQVISATEDTVQGVGSTYNVKPQVAVISSSLDRRGLKAHELSRRMRSMYPEMKVVMLLDSSTPESVVEAFRAGAQGVFCRTGSVKALRKCILCVHAGQVWANSDQIRYLLESLFEVRLKPLIDSRGLRLLSKREEDVLHCAVDGLKNREIAAQLHLSEHTIKNYMFRIFDKLGVSSRVEMILYALSQRSSSSSTVLGYELVRNSDSQNVAKPS